MSANLSARIDRMFRLDCVWAWGFVVVLWCVVGFVLSMIAPLASDGTVRTVMFVAAGLLVVFNTASIAAMIRHYAHDKDFIYGLDIRHLDASRQAAAAPVVQPAE